MNPCASVCLFAWVFVCLFLSACLCESVCACVYKVGLFVSVNVVSSKRVVLPLGRMGRNSCSPGLPLDITPQRLSCTDPNLNYFFSHQ